MGRERITIAAFGVISALALFAHGARLTATVAAASAAQTSVSAADLESLQQDLDRVRSEVDRLPAAEPSRDDLQTELDQLDDEVAYFRVMVRRGNAVPQREVDQLRHRVSALERRLTDRDVTIPVGTEMDVRLQSSLSSDTAEVEDRFFATVVADLRVADRLAVPAGAEVRGLVSGVDRSSRTDRSASLTLTFDQLTVDPRTYPARLTLTEAQKSGLKDEAGRIGIGAGVGGVIGGLLGGVRGALAGILIGAGGTVVATEGEDVNLPAGTVLRVRFDTALTILPASR